MGDGSSTYQLPVHKLLLIRHGETVDNVKGLYAGVRDSLLTSHGVQQASKLGQYCAQTQLTFTHIFSSTLSRAFKTADAIRVAQPKQEEPVDVVALGLLKEQDFGYYEGKSFHTRSAGSGKSGKDQDRELHKDDADFQDVESKESMAKRADAFLDQHLLPVLAIASDKNPVIIAVVSHGMLLSSLWKCLLKRQNSGSVSVAPEVLAERGSLPLEHIGGWSNTGYLDLELQNVQSDGTDNALSITIKAVNKKDHLQGLKRTRGGVGSAAHDEGQRSLDNFFKKKKTT